MGLSVEDVLQHARDRHSQQRLLFRHVPCGKTYRYRQAAQVHAAKCVGPAPPPESDWPCSACGAVYSSQRALSTHERHKHQRMRNNARAAAEVPKDKSVPKGGKVFTTEDICAMLNMEIEFEGKYNIAQLMHKTGKFPNKTIKQIRDKRCEKL